MSNCCPSNNVITIPCKGIGIMLDSCGGQSTDLSDIEKRLDELEKKQQSGSASFTLCEFYYFRNPKRPKGFEPAQGSIIEHAKDFYPEAWAFLQTDEGKALCVTEDEWQAMTKAVWATLADGTEVGFNGIGGAPFYVQDLDAGTLRLPDLRGMYAEASGFDGLGVGGVHGDIVRNATGITGAFIDKRNDVPTSINGVFYVKNTSPALFFAYNINLNQTTVAGFDLSRVVPTGNANKPRAWGANACVYLGKPNINSEG